MPQIRPAMSGLKFPAEVDTAGAAFLPISGLGSKQLIATDVAPPILDSRTHHDSLRFSSQASYVHPHLLKKETPSTPAPLGLSLPLPVISPQRKLPVAPALQAKSNPSARSGASQPKYPRMVSLTGRGRYQLQIDEEQSLGLYWHYNSTYGLESPRLSALAVSQGFRVVPHGMDPHKIVVLTKNGVAYVLQYKMRTDLDESPVIFEGLAQRISQKKSRQQERGWNISFTDDRRRQPKTYRLNIKKSAEGALFIGRHPFLSRKGDGYGTWAKYVNKNCLVVRVDEKDRNITVGPFLIYKTNEEDLVVLSISLTDYGNILRGFKILPEPQLPNTDHVAFGTVKAGERAEMRVEDSDADVVIRFSDVNRDQDGLNFDDASYEIISREGPRIDNLPIYKKGSRFMIPGLGIYSVETMDGEGSIESDTEVYFQVSATEDESSWLEMQSLKEAKRAWREEQKVKNKKIEAQKEGNAEGDGSVVNSKDEKSNPFVLAGPRRAMRRKIVRSKKAETQADPEKKTSGFYDEYEFAYFWRISNLSFYHSAERAWKHLGGS